MAKQEGMRPGTPLPWVRNKYGKPYSGNECDTIRLREFATAMSGDLEDAKQNDAYVFHAANAYPKLVALINDYLYTAAAPHKLAVGDVDDKARALLRELGEIK